MNFIVYLLVAILSIISKTFIYCELNYAIIGRIQNESLDKVDSLSFQVRAKSSDGKNLSIYLNGNFLVDLYPKIIKDIENNKYVK